MILDSHSPNAARRDDGAAGDRLAGVLVGTAIGDALGLPMEGMRASAIARMFPHLDRYRLLGKTGFVSDDTEQSALVAQSLARCPRDQARFVRDFRAGLLGWFLRLPWGIGLGTLRACIRIALGLRRSGVSSAGNGAAMRAAIVGAFFFEDTAARRAWSDALARVTHTDPRAVEGARFVAELAAACVRRGPEAVSVEVVAVAAEVVLEPSMQKALANAMALARNGAALDVATRELGNTGFVLHSVAIATFCFLRFGRDPATALAEAVRAGGDTDSNAAIVGAWLGAAHGARGLPPLLVEHLQRGPFGRRHLESLAADLQRARIGGSSTVTRYSWLTALGRNLALYPVVLFHACRVIGRR